MKRTCGLALALLLAAPFAAHATGFNAVGGASVTASGRVTPVLFGSVYGQHSLFDAVTVEPIATVGWIDSRHIKTDDLDHSVFVAGGGARILTRNRHWFLGIQVAATSTRTNALSSRFEFIDSAGWQYRHFTVMVRHISNASILGRGQNMGETMLLAGVRW